jgi:hypothetical protein
MGTAGTSMLLPGVADFYTVTGLSIELSFVVWEGCDYENRGAVE